LSDALSSLKLPPTICFTCPLCKSMQGRNMSSFRDTIDWLSKAEPATSKQSGGLRQRGRPTADRLRHA
jgi:hypothetical protein